MSESPAPTPDPASAPPTPSAEPAPAAPAETVGAGGTAVAPARASAASSARDQRYRRRLPQRLRRRRFNHAPLQLGAVPAATEAGGGGGPAARAAAAGAEAKISELNRIVDKHKEHTTRLQAEFENFRRRSRKEMDDVRATASAGLMGSLLPALDNFNRALRTPGNSFEDFMQGVQMIHTHLLNLLKDDGLETVHAKGKKFDPHMHEAVAVDTSGEHEDDMIVEVLQDGYILKGKLLRPALVKVARRE